MTDGPEFFFGSILLDAEGRAKGHGISDRKENLTRKKSTQKADEQESKPKPLYPTEFQEVFDFLIRNIEPYWHFMPIVISMGPALVRSVAEDTIAKFIEKEGELIEHNKEENINIYKINKIHYTELWERQKRFELARTGGSILPEVLLVGLISTYDSFLSYLLRVALTKKPEIAFSSDRQITLKDLLKYSSIEEAKQYVFEKEVENIIRNSHQEQLNQIKSKFSIETTKDLSILPQFVEICERRNLLVHTGGIVSQQYLNVCEQYNCLEKDIHVGTKLKVGRQYYKKSVEIVYEIAMKICYILWRKLESDSKDIADSELNAKCYDLIREKNYRLAENLLVFGHKVPGISDLNKKMMVVNLANIYRETERKKEARELLGKIDWSAANFDFTVAVAAVREEDDHVIELLKKSPPDFSRDHYRDWPVFSNLRKNAEFQTAFQSTFGEPLIKISPSDIENN